MTECEDWEEVHAFASPDDCRQFASRIEDAVDEGALIAVAVESRFAGEMRDERWLQDPKDRHRR